MRRANDEGGTPIIVKRNLTADDMAGIVAHLELRNPPLLRLNPRHVDEMNAPCVLSWARGALAAGHRVSWLTADELAGLA